MTLAENISKRLHVGNTNTDEVKGIRINMNEENRKHGYKAEMSVHSLL